MGLLDRLRHDHHDDAQGEQVDPVAVVRDYQEALRSASPAVVVAAHAEALREFDPQDLVEFRRRLDLRLSHPEARGDASVDAVAADLGLLEATGSGAVFRLIEGHDEGADAASSTAGHDIPVSDVASGFLSSQVWATASGREPRHRRAIADGEEQGVDPSVARATAELHNLRRDIGTDNIGR